MDRKLARKNIRSGLIAGAVCVFMFGITFVAAAIYVTRERRSSKNAPPAGEEIHLPGPTLIPSSMRGRDHADRDRHDDRLALLGGRRRDLRARGDPLDPRHAPRRAHRSPKSTTEPVWDGWRCRLAPSARGTRTAVGLLVAAWWPAWSFRSARERPHRSRGASARAGRKNAKRVGVSRPARLGAGRSDRVG